MKVVIYGAGSIGCYIGAILHLEQINVHLLGRARVQQNIERAGAIFISDYEERNDKAENVPFSCHPEVLTDADVVLVTLKCTAMENAIAELQSFCSPSALVVCLQNGVGVQQKVQQALPQHNVLSGIVPFNVVQTEAHFHRATEGGLHFPIHSSLLPLQAAFQAYGLGCQLNSNIEEVIWGKLLLNLNNAINALSDIPLKEQLSKRSYRLVLAACQREMLRLCKHNNIKPAKLTAVAPHWIPTILSLPDWLFAIVAQKMLAIDPTARSSMWEDLQQGRATEIDYLNGAVVALAEKSGIAAPANKMVSQWITSLTNASGRNAVSGEALLQALQEPS
ncbi:MAG: 2-dehydropantoate 2-reductase [Aestuariibacter sp.]